MRGVVAGLHVKSAVPGERGLPKRPVPELAVRTRGVEGVLDAAAVASGAWPPGTTRIPDQNVYRAGREDGDLGAAVLLFPEEVLHELALEGWPLVPGSIGENVLTRGIPYDATPPGTRIRIGTATVVVDRACEPCRNLHLVVGEERIVPFLRRMVHRRGWYARVEEEGAVRVGDAVEVL